MPRRGERSVLVGTGSPAGVGARSLIGDPSAGSVPRPTVTTEPVTSTAPAPIDDVDGLARLGQRRGRGRSRRPSVGHDADAVLAEDLHGGAASSAADRARGVEFWVHTRCSRYGSKAASRPSWSLSAITPITPMSGRNEKESSSAAAAASAPCGLCAASSRIVGAAPDDLQAARASVTSANAARTTSSSSTPRPEERLDRGERHGGVLGLVGAVERQEQVVVAPPAAPAGSDTWPPTAGVRRATPNSRPSRASVAPTSAARANSDCGDLVGLLGEHADAPGLMIPAFSMAIGHGVVAEVLGVVDGDRQSPRRPRRR